MVYALKGWRSRNGKYQELPVKRNQDRQKRRNPLLIKEISL